MYHLDTNACIDFMRGRLPLGYDLLKNTDPRLVKIPAVVEAELRLGALKSARPDKVRRTVEQFLLPFETVPFDGACAREYALIRADLESRGCPIGPNDLLIAATARAHGAILVTANVREFKRVAGLSLQDWSEEAI